MSLPNYRNYKDSGAKWVGRIPKHWDVGPLKRMLDIQNGADHKNVEHSEGFPVIGSGGPFTFATEFLYDGESVLLGRKGTIDKPLYVTGKFWTVDTMYWSKVRPGTWGRFAYYVTLTIPFDYYSTSTAVPSMTKSALGAHLVACPPIDEQIAIAAFLDRETAKVDALISEQEKLITLLAEKHQATISHSVTKGLDRSAPMKDSGVSWLGEIPAHWDVVGLTKYLDSVVDYRGRTPEKVEGGVFLVTAKNIRNGVVDYGASQEYIAFSQYDEVMRRGKPIRGDVLFTTEAPLGQVALVDREDIALAQRIIKFRASPKHLLNSYLKAWIMGSACQFNLEQLATGSTALGIKGSKIGQVRLCRPPLDEQEAIVSFIDAELEKLDKLKREAVLAIGLLSERRAALIVAAVTGEIDVRGITLQHSTEVWKAIAA